MYNFHFWAPRINFILLKHFKLVKPSLFRVFRLICNYVYQLFSTFWLPSLKLCVSHVVYDPLECLFNGIKAFILFIFHHINLIQSKTCMLHGKNCISEHLFLYVRCQCGMDNFPISNVFITQLKLLETQIYHLMKLFLLYLSYKNGLVFLRYYENFKSPDIYRHTYS